MNAVPCGGVLTFVGHCIRSLSILNEEWLSLEANHYAGMYGSSVRK